MFENLSIDHFFQQMAVTRQYKLATNSNTNCLEKHTTINLKMEFWDLKDVVIVRKLSYPIRKPVLQNHNA